MMRRLTARALPVALALLGALLWAPRASACASCACGTTAPMAPGLDVPFAGRVRVGVLTDAASVADDSSVVVASQARLGVWWAPSPRLVLDAALPVGARVRFNQETGASTGRAIHLGDATVGARLVLFRDRAFGPRHIGSLRVSMTTPTGPEVMTTPAVGKPVPLSSDLQPSEGAFIPRAELAWLSIPHPSLQLLAVAAVKAPLVSTRALAPAVGAEVAAVAQWMPTPAGHGPRAGLRTGVSARLIGAERRGELEVTAGQRASVMAVAGAVVEVTPDVLVLVDVGAPLWSEPMAGGGARDRAVASLSVIADLPSLRW